jgi:hypothetical protein
MIIKTRRTEVGIVTGNTTKVVQIGKMINISRGSQTTIMIEGTTEGIRPGAGILMTEIEGRLKTEREGLSMKDETSELKESTIHSQRVTIEKKEADLQGEVDLQKPPVAMPEKIKHKQKTWLV